MTLRATLFPKTGFKQDVDSIDFDKTHFGAATVIPVSIKRESCDFVIDVQNVQGGEIPSKSKDLDQNYMTSKVSLAATVAELVQGDNKTVGILSPVRQMGGEGTPVKGKPLSADTMDNPQMAMNNNPKDAGADDSVKGVVPGVLGTASIELSAEGKWRNIRKTPANPHTQANCLRQILLLQLDLIEQQQQQLQSKDKEIDELKADKETVCICFSANIYMDLESSKSSTYFFLNFPFFCSCLHALSVWSVVCSSQGRTRRVTSASSSPWSHGPLTKRTCGIWM